MTKSNHFNFKDELKKFTRHLQIKEIFNNTSFEDKSTNPPNPVYNPPTKPAKTNNSDLQ